MAPTYEETVGGTVVVLKGYDSGMRKLVLDEMFARTLMAHANASKVRAIAAAKAYPTRYWGAHGSQRRTRVHYENSFTVDIGYGVHADGTARIRARLANTNPFALYIEYGNRNINARRFVRTAAGIHRFDAQGDK
jgi:hypothetical protein